MATVKEKLIEKAEALGLATGGLTTKQLQEVIADHDGGEMREAVAAATADVPTESAAPAGDAPTERPQAPAEHPPMPKATARRGSGLVSYVAKMRIKGKLPGEVVNLTMTEARPLLKMKPPAIEAV